MSSEFELGWQSLNIWREIVKIQDRLSCLLFFKHLLYINLFDYFVAHVYVFFLVLPWVFLHFIQKLHRVKSGAKKKSTYPIMDK